MEGYVRLVGVLKYSRLYCILDGQQLSFYNTIDKSRKMAVGMKSIHFIQNAKIEKVKRDHGRTMCIKLELQTSATKKTIIIFDCYGLNNCGEWYNALMRASKFHISQQEKQNQLTRHINCLGFDGENIKLLDLSRIEMKKQYTRKSLILHPDKGGNADDFAAIGDAYRHLISLYDAQELLTRGNSIEYEAIIKKTRVGMGLTVKYDKFYDRLLVTEVDPDIEIEGITEEANGIVKVGDILRCVDNDDCTNWPFSRLRARLGVREAFGTTVRFTMQRISMDDEKVEVQKPNTFTNNDKNDNEYRPAQRETNPVFVEATTNVRDYNVKDFVIQKEENNNDANNKDNTAHSLPIYQNHFVDSTTNNNNDNYYDSNIYDNKKNKSKCTKYNPHEHLNEDFSNLSEPKFNWDELPTLEEFRAENHYEANAGKVIADLIAARTQAEIQYKAAEQWKRQYLSIQSKVEKLQHDLVQCNKREHSASNAIKALERDNAQLRDDLETLQKVAEDKYIDKIGTLNFSATSVIGGLLEEIHARDKTNDHAVPSNTHSRSLHLHDQSNIFEDVEKRTQALLEKMEMANQIAEEKSFTQI